MAWPNVPPPPTFPAQLAGKVVCLNRPSTFKEKVIALTFDDGPSPFTTPFVLQSLKKYNAKATFFCLGNMLRNREWIVRQTAAEGHEIGNHSCNHRPRPPQSVAVAEVDGTNERLKNILGYEPRTYRPPYGIQNASTTLRAQQNRMPIVLWTCDTNDWRVHNTGAVIAAAARGIQPGGVILMHDIHQHTARAVPAILALLHSKGYQCITVSEMMSKWQAQADADARAALAAAQAKAAQAAQAAQAKPTGQTSATR